METPLTKTKVLLADDHQMFMEGLKMILNHEDDIEVVGMALDGLEVLQILQQQAADVLLLDLEMPRLDGHATLQQLLTDYPHLKTVVVSFSKEGDQIARIMESGAQGYILKNQGGTEVITAIRAVMRGEVFYSQEIMKAMSAYMAERMRQPSKPTVPTLEPSAREREVMACLLAGLTSKQIGDELCIAPTTVETHKRNLKEKFGLVNAAQIASFAQRLGITPHLIQPKKK